MIDNLLLLGFGWFVVFYLSFTMLYARAEKRLDAHEKALLLELRRPLRPIPFAFAAGLISLVALHPTGVWFFLIVAGSLVIALLHWRFRKSTLPQAYVSSFSTSSILLAIGIIGLALSIGYGCGYAL
jgi:hypothetical protein